MKLGDRVDRFTVVDRLGDGGMASVYGVRHTTLGTPHALKVLTIQAGDVKERLVQEGKLQARLAHENIVAVTDVLDINGSPGLLMEYIRGPSLDEWLVHHLPSLDEALAVFRGILQGISHAHEIGVVHRDLKPGNVMLHIAADGRVVPKVMDFGLAKSFRRKLRASDTRDGAIMGTPAYMPPEQIRDASTVDRRADIYALGCILFELVTHRRAFQGDDVAELFAQICAGDAPSVSEHAPHAHDGVVDAIEGMMAVDRRHRISDCAAIVEVLHEASALDSLTVAGPRPTLEGLPPPRALGPLKNVSLAPDSPGAQVAHRLQRADMTSLGSETGAPIRVEPPPPVAAPVLPAPRVSVGTSLFALSGFAIAVFLAAVIAGGVVMAVVVPRLTAEVPEPRGPVEPVVPVVPDPVVPPSPPIQPEPDPTVPTPDPEPDPVKSPPPEPIQPEPVEPEPVEPEPIEPEPIEPEPVRPVGTATYSVSADASVARVALVGPSGSFGPGAPMPAGFYEIRLWKQDGLIANAAAGSVEVADGATLTIVCSGMSSRCFSK